MKKHPRRKKKTNVREVLGSYQMHNIPIDELEHADYNPRKMTRSVIEDVKDSIRRFGYAEPAVVNIRGWDNDRKIIVGGHKRHIALQELRDTGEWEVGYMPCMVVALNEFEEKALNVALNKIQDEWDYAKLPDVIESIRAGDASLVPRTGFKEPELRGLIVDAQASRVLFDEPGGEKRPVLKVEPRDEEEYKRVQRALGSPGSQLLNMEKVLKACRLLRRKGRRRK